MEKEDSGEDDSMERRCSVSLIELVSQRRRFASLCWYSIVEPKVAEVVSANPVSTVVHIYEGQLRALTLESRLAYRKLSLPPGLGV